MVSQTCAMHRPLLVIDLNGVLVDRRDQQLEGRPALGKWGMRYAYERQHAGQFVEWAAGQVWHVGLWTSAKQKNAVLLARAALGDACAAVSFVYAQEQCEVAGVCSEGRPIFQKPLARLWREGLGVPKRTVLLDDGRDKICTGEEDNALICPKYDASAGDDFVLAQGGWLRTALLDIMAADDVRDRIVQSY